MTALSLLPKVFSPLHRPLNIYRTMPHCNESFQACEELRGNNFHLLKMHNFKSQASPHGNNQLRVICGEPLRRGDTLLMTYLL